MIQHYFYNYEVLDENGEQICIFTVTKKNPNHDPERVGSEHFRATDKQTIKHLGITLDGMIHFS